MQFGHSTSSRLLPSGRKNADGLLGDTHEAAYGLVIHTHLVEDEEEGVEGYLLIICKSRSMRRNICEEICTFVDEGVNKSAFLCPILKKIVYFSPPFLSIRIE